MGAAVMVQVNARKLKRVICAHAPGGVDRRTTKKWNTTRCTAIKKVLQRFHRRLSTLFKEVEKIVKEDILDTSKKVCVSDHTAACLCLE